MESQAPFQSLKDMKNAANKASETKEHRAKPGMEY